MESIKLSFSSVLFFGVFVSSSIVADLMIYQQLDDMTQPFLNGVIITKYALPLAGWMITVGVRSRLRGSTQTP